jgi:hypothetical protein
LIKTLKIKRYLAYFVSTPNVRIQAKIGEFDELEDAMAKVEEQRRTSSPTDFHWDNSFGQLYDIEMELLYVKQGIKYSLVWTHFHYKI